MDARILTSLFCLLSWAAPAAAQDTVPLPVTRMAAPAKLILDRKSRALEATAALQPGQRISTGANGRVTLGAGGGSLTVGGDSEIYLHSSETLEGSTVVRLVLTRGALQTAAGDSAQAPLDLRLNIGPLRVRALGASLWAAQEPRGETICLLSGSAEVVAEFGTERLYEPGECLWFSAQNRRLLLKPDSTGGALARKLQRTEYAPEAPAPAIALVPEPAAPLALPAAPAGGNETPSLPASPESAGVTASELPAPAEPPASAAATPSWTLVVASPSTAAAAESYAASLRARGQPARLRAGEGRYRVCVGSFASKAEAGAYRAQLQQDLQISGAWILAE